MDSWLVINRSSQHPGCIAHILIELWWHNRINTWLKRRCWLSFECIFSSASIFLLFWKMSRGHSVARWFVLCVVGACSSQKLALGSQKCLLWWHDNHEEPFSSPQVIRIRNPQVMFDNRKENTAGKKLNQLFSYYHCVFIEPAVFNPGTITSFFVHNCKIALQLNSSLSVCLQPGRRKHRLHHHHWPAEGQMEFGEGLSVQDRCEFSGTAS